MRKVIELTSCSLALGLLSPNFAVADSDHFVVDGGLGIFETQGIKLSQVKFAKFGLQEEVWDTLKQRLNAGGWLDNRGKGYRGSSFAGYQLGFQVDNDSYESSVFFGPNVISSPDISLGGYMQFNVSLFFGIKDRNGNAIGVAYNHFSSAGIETPNLGRDYGCLEIKF